MSEHTVSPLYSSWYRSYLSLCDFQTPQVLGEAMAGISQHCKTGDVVAFGDSVGVASKALCGLTEAAGQVRSQHGHNSLSQTLLLWCFFKSAWPSALYSHLDKFAPHSLAATCFSHTCRGIKISVLERRTEVMGIHTGSKMTWHRKGAYMNKWRGGR